MSTTTGPKLRHIEGGKRCELAHGHQPIGAGDAAPYAVLAVSEEQVMVRVPGTRSIVTHLAHEVHTMTIPATEILAWQAIRDAAEQQDAELAATYSRIVADAERLARRCGIRRTYDVGRGGSLRRI